MGYRDYSTAKGHIVDATGHGDFTTIQAAITAASSGQTVFVRPGTYTENLTLKAGVNISGFSGDGYTPNVIILGKATASGAGTFTLSSVQLKTNSDFCLLVSGSSATTVIFNNSYINCSNNTGISYTTSNASSSITFYDCTLNLATTGIAYYSSSSTGAINFYRTDLENTGGSSTASSNSAGSVGFFNSVGSAPISTSGTGLMVGFAFNINTTAQNVTSITTAGSGASNAFTNCAITSGSASAVSIGTGTTLALTNSVLNSSNTNVLTGLGTLQYGLLVFSGSSSGHNVSTETPFATLF